MSQEPLFAFGYGLSYTTFTYGKVQLSNSKIKIGETFSLTVPVTNTGKLAGEEVVQVYLKKSSDTNGPNKTLRAFKRVAITPGKTENVTFNFTNDQMEWWDESTNTMRVHAGEYQLMVGKSSRAEDLTTVNFQIQ